jgi:Ca-activated chloride channel family protein
VSSLRANGGTNMLSALQRALIPNTEFAQLRQVIFITDGAVGNEMELYRYIEERLGGSRLFTVGIGPAPNSWFMKEAAQFGRGTFTFIGRTDEVEARMGELFAKIASPVLSDLKVEFGDPNVEVWPDRLPDLYAGEPIFVTVRMPPSATIATITGRTSGAPFKVEVPLKGGAKERGIHKLWARAKIEALTDRIVLGTPEAEVQPTITSVALAHGLVSKYTSLVAVDVTPTVPSEVPIAEANTAPNQQAYATSMPKTATPAELMLWASFACALLALSVGRRTWSKA